VIRRACLLVCLVRLFVRGSLVVISRQLLIFMKNWHRCSASVPNVTRNFFGGQI